MSGRYFLEGELEQLSERRWRCTIPEHGADVTAIKPEDAMQSAVEKALEKIINYAFKSRETAPNDVEFGIRQPDGHVWGVSISLGEYMASRLAKRDAPHWFAERPR